MEEHIWIVADLTQKQRKLSNSTWLSPWTTRQKTWQEGSKSPKARGALATGQSRREDCPIREEGRRGISQSDDGTGRNYKSDSTNNCSIQIRLTMAANFLACDVVKSCDSVINSVRASSLNFSIQETPYSLFLTIRKSFLKSTHVFSPSPIKVARENPAIVHDLEIRMKSAEKANLTLKENYEDAISGEECHKTINELKQLKLREEKIEAPKAKVIELENKFKHDKTVLEGELEEAEKKWKLQNKSLKVKDKEMHDLKKQNEYTEEILMKVKAEYKDFNVKINKEKEFLNSLIPSLKADSLECNNCDVKVESVKALKMHKRAVHMKSNLTQTEESVLEDKCVQFSEDKIVETLDQNAQVSSKYLCTSFRYY